MGVVSRFGKWAICALLLFVWCSASVYGADLWLESRPHPEKGLEGNRILLDPGHGRTWNDTTQQWGWQRPILFGEVEDLINPRIVNRWLVPYLQNAGAVVLTTRERDEQLNEMRIDDGAGVGAFEAVGDWSSTSFPDAWDGTAHVAQTQNDLSGPIAVWYADFPKTDRYGLCIRIPSVDQTTTATYVVHTAGGDVQLRLNQQRNRAQWLWIDWFVFPAGHQRVLTLTTYAEETGKNVVADAIRLGGGMGDIDWGGGVSGLPRWQEYSKSYAKMYGAPQYVWDAYVEQSDYGVRNSFMSWWGGDIAFHHHTNSDATGSGSASGTVSPYTYAKTDEEATRIVEGHRRVTKHIKDQWLSTWRDRGDPAPVVNSGYSYPSWLIELAFHDRLEPDLVSLLDPDFRSIAARGMYEGIARVVRGENVVFLPEPPSALAIQNVGSGNLRVRWSPPGWGPDVVSYRVQQSPDGLGFDPGVDVGNATETVLGSYQSGEIVYVRVVAENEGGRSFPTETLGARVGDPDSLLIVNGFDRLDRYVQETDNPRTFIREHLSAFSQTATTMGIDSSSNEAILEGTVALGSYEGVDWILGRESIGDRTFSSEEQLRVSEYVSGGGSLFASGTDIALDLVDNGTEADRDFAKQRLHIGFDETSRVRTYAFGIMANIFDAFECDVSTTPGSPYNVDFPDALLPDAGGEVVLKWGDGTAAGIAYPYGPGKTLVLSTPLEAIVEEADRNLMAAIVLDYLVSPVEPDTIDPQILSVGVGDVAATWSEIGWETDEPVIATIEWGTDTTYGHTAGPSSDYLTHDSLTVFDLPSETPIHFRVMVSDYSGNMATSDDYSFTTLAPDLTPPAVVDLNVFAFSDRSAILVWKTDEAAISHIEYGLSTQYGITTADNTTFDTQFSAVLTGLTPDTKYHFRITTRDFQRNNGATEDSTFLTQPLDTTPPTVTNPNVLDVSDHDAVVFWITDEPATSQIEWGLDDSFGSLSVMEDEFTFAHFHYVDGLTSTSLLHLRPVSVDDAGNVGYGDTLVFLTASDIPQVIVDNADSGFSVDGVWSTSTMVPEQRYGPDYRWKAVRYPGDPILYARWRGMLPRAGRWLAHCWYVIGSNRSSDTPYYIQHPEGEEVIRVDQMNDGGVFFHPIGSAHYYEAGQAEIAMSNDGMTGRVVVADAVMWLFSGVGEPWRYRFVTSMEVLNQVLNRWPLDTEVESDVDVNGDGTVDVADYIRSRLP